MNAQSPNTSIGLPTYPVLATAWLRIKTATGEFQAIRVVCDWGAQVNLLTETVFKELKVMRESSKGKIIGIGDASVDVHGKIVTTIWHREKDLAIGSGAFVIINDFDWIQPQQSFSVELFSGLEEEDFADPRYNMAGPADGILGVGFLSAHLKCDLRRNSMGLLAQDTSFGWVVFGGAEPEAEYNLNSNIGIITAAELHSQIKRLWEIDELNAPTVMSPDELACEQLYQRAVVKRGNRYVVPLLLKPASLLGESKAIARRRLHCLENRFQRNPELKRNYVNFMIEYEQLGHMRRADPLEPAAPHYYIPHHAVAVDQKFRVVFDASAKTSNGVSLNEVQYVGPRLQGDLADLIMEFRTGQYAITADIRKMFRQVEILPEYWDYQRILWRESADRPIKEYWLTVVTYGMASSPYNAVKTLIQCAEDNSERFPRAAHIVKNKFYMDDMLVSVETVADAIELRTDVAALLREGGFELVKWRSNCKSIADEPSEAKMVAEPDSTSVLGIVWNFQHDEFQFKVRSREHPEVITKRIISSEAARIFDPQGYVTPITVRAKLFIQEAWRTHSDWNDPLPPELQSEWHGYYKELSMISEIRIPRWLGTTSTAACQIHVFCDASSKAYGAVAYVRTLTNGQWKSRLLSSRSKVAPLKPVTIPRLELYAMELGSKLLMRIKRVADLAAASFTMWTDSEIVLFWLRKPAHELKTFVANRVNRILRSIEVERSHHVRSEMNPADLLSRGTKAETLRHKSLWWNGPDMLSDEWVDWPIWNGALNDPEMSNQVQLETKFPTFRFHNVLLNVMTEQDEEVSLLEKMSSHRKACRVTTYVLRFCARLYAPISRRRAAGLACLELYASGSWKAESIVTIVVDERVIAIPSPSAVERENALHHWIKLSQQEFFPSEYAIVQRGQSLTKRSSLWTLTPHMDKSGVLRIRGRLNNLNLPGSKKNPIILHRKSLIALRLAEESHQILCHGGVQMCTQYLRNKYWIIGIRVLLRQIVYSCVTCTRYRQKTSIQFMADLPVIRLQPAPAFHCTGVDYAGPFKLKVNRNTTTKGYIAVFICMTYKAVHLELVSSMDAEAFVAALTRFINLRAGCVRHIYSDNGTNFVRADRELREAAELWLDREVMQHLETHSIEWHFNPPCAPHHGGLWEAAVKSAKYHLKRMSGAHLFTYEELATLLAKITACLNSRPLTPISADPNDLLTLTPGHFITRPGQVGIAPYEALLAEVPMNRLSAWQRIRKLQQDFWARWSQEYITEQQVRNKWADSYRSLRVGDLVLIKDEITPPCQWLMGRITQVFPGKDGKVRSCEVKTVKTIYRRPITQLCLLPIDLERGADEASEVGFPQL